MWEIILVGTIFCGILTCVILLSIDKLTGTKFFEDGCSSGTSCCGLG